MNLALLALTAWLIFISTQPVTLVFAASIVIIFAALLTGRLAGFSWMRMTWPVFVLILIGLLGAVGQSAVSERAIFRDIFYIAKIPAIVMASVVFAQMVTAKEVLRAVLLAGIGLAMLYVVDYQLNQGWAMDRRELRTVIGRGYFLVGMSGATALALACEASRSRASRIWLLALSVMLYASLALPQSRTLPILSVFLLFAFIWLRLGFRARSLVALGCVCVAILSLPVFNFSGIEVGITMFDNAIQEMFVRNFGDMQEIRVNFRAYEAYVAWNAFIDGSSLQQIFGSGFGEQINLGVIVELGTTASGQSFYDAVPITHISVMTAIIKFGWIGLFFYMYLAVTLTSPSRSAERMTLRVVNLGSALVVLYVIWLFQGFFANLDILIASIAVLAITGEHLGYVPQKAVRSNARQPVHGAVPDRA